jgi:hypothetical protein
MIENGCAGPPDGHGEGDPMARDPSSLPEEDANVEEVTWRIEGLLAGVLGAFVIAVFFLLFDVVSRRPLWTPFALGSAFFLNRLPAPDAPIDPVIVVGYTAMHGGFFVTFGLIAAFYFDTQWRPRASVGRAALLALLLFVAFELCFWLFARMFVPDAFGVVGVLRVTVANLLAAIAMAGWIVVRAARGVGTRDMAPS